MSVSEKRAWTEVLIWLVALVYVWIRFTAGWEVAGQSFGLQVVEQGAGQVLATYLGIAIFAVAVQIGLYSFLGSRGEDVEFRDERDQMIETRSNQIAYWTGAVTLNVIIVHVLASEALGRGREMMLDLASPTGFVFALLVAMLLQEIVRNGARLVLHRLS